MVFEQGPDAFGFGPNMVDTQVRQALQTCWMMLPAGKKSLDGLEAEFRRLVDRALRDAREDGEAFGMGTPPETNL
ncbi:MAG: hypothetical protein U0836_13650 [Pirellulales bacterium]